MFLIDFIQRVYTAFNPPSSAKKDGAVRMGLLGASNIAPFAVISPAQSHPEVIIAAVAARDQQRARAYATKYRIPIVHKTYQDLLDDPSIDAVYIALPNGLHFEWALRSLRAGKHVLLEKPSCSNAIEAKKLFTHPLATGPNAPVLLEAFHYQFHPAWLMFLSQIQDGKVKHAHAESYLARGIMPNDDIRFKYDLAGGTLMDLGTYPVSAVRQMLRRESILPVDFVYRPMPLTKYGVQAEPQIDHAITASFETASGQTAKIIADLSLTTSWSKHIPCMGWPKAEAELEEVEVPGSSSGGGVQRFKQRTVTMWNFMLPTIYHRIDVHDRYTLRRQGEIVKTWEETKHLKAYNWPKGDERAGNYQDWWTTYRCQLEEFVNRIKGRKGTGVWIDGKESIAQMEVIDATYKKMGLGIRPTSTFDSDL